MGITVMPNFLATSSLMSDPLSVTILTVIGQDVLLKIEMVSRLMGKVYYREQHMNRSLQEVVLSAHLQSPRGEHKVRPMRRYHLQHR